jgi:hypothetical protein
VSSTGTPRDAPAHDFLDTNGRQVHAFALRMQNLGFVQLTETLIAMFKSGAWMSFSDGLGDYRFLPGEFDYFLTQQGVLREDVMAGVRDISLKAELDGAMDERRTGEDEYRRTLNEARDANPKRPQQPIEPFGFSRREAAILVDEGRLAKSASRPPLGPSARRYRNSGGVTSKSIAKRLPKVERLKRAALLLPNPEFQELLAALSAEKRARRL